LSDFYYAQQRFSDNAEYLFFVSSKMLREAWFFGLRFNSEVKALDTIPYQMQIKAYALDPSNTLFEWACCYNRRDERTASLAHLILSEKKSIVEWLYSKGEMGQDVVGVLIRSSNNYL
jgi:hypothetical protein